MARITTNEPVFPSKATDSSIDLVRLENDSLNLAMHVLSRDSDTDSTSDQTNNNSGDGYGTAIAAGGTLSIQEGAQVSGGSIKILADAGKDSDGGVLRIDGSSLSLGRLVASGNIADGGSSDNLDLTNTEADTDIYPTLEMRNGANLLMTGAQGNNYRAFLGNHNKGRIKAYDSSINFGGTDRSGFKATGSARPNMFLGTNSRFNNVLIKDPQRVEMTGSIKEFENVTISYGSNNDTASVGGMFFGNDDVQATLGAHNIEIPVTLATAYNNVNNVYTPYVSFRADALNYTINGPVQMRFTDATIPPASHLLYFQGGGNAGLNNTVTFKSQLATTVNLFDTDNNLRPWDSSGDVKYGLMDNRDFLEISKDASGFQSGSLRDTEFTYYHIEKHAIAGSFGDQRVMLGWPTGKAAAAPGFKDGSATRAGLDDPANYNDVVSAFYHGNPGDFFSVDNTAFGGMDARLTADMRRFYPMRAGYSQWGYYPEFHHEGLGTDFFLGIDGPSPPYQIQNLRSADASVAAFRNGTNIVVNAAEDPVTSGVTLANARGVNVTVTDPTGPNGRLVLKQNNSAITLDQLYQRAAVWTHDHIDDTDVVWTAPELTEALRDDGGFSPVYADTDIPVRSVGFYATNEPNNTTVPLPSGANWDDVQSMVCGGSTQFFRFSFGSNASQTHQWTLGHIYFWMDSENWGFYEFSRFDGEQLVGGSHDNDVAHLRHIASAGTITGTNINLQRGSLRDSLSISEAYPVRSYLWNPAVALRPVQSDLIGVNEMIVRRTTLEQSDSEGRMFTKGTLVDTVMLHDTDARFNANSRGIDVNISGNGVISNFMPTTNAATPSLLAGNKVTGQIPVQRGQEYIVAGDASEATFVPEGTGADPIVNITGNGMVPGATPGVVFQRSVSVTFRTPSADTAWDTDLLDSELWINIAAVATPRDARPEITGRIHEPFARTPGNAIGRDEVPFTYSGTGWSLTTASSATATPTLGQAGTLPTSWTGLLSDTDNTGVAVQFTAAHNANHLTDLAAAIADTDRNIQMVMFGDTDNWAVMNMRGGTDVQSNRLLATITGIHTSVGVPQNTMSIFFNLDTDNRIVPLYNETAFVQGRSVSADGRDLTYTFELASNQDLRWAFSARAGERGNWFAPVSNRMATNVNAQTINLTTLSSTFVPQALSTQEGIASQFAWFRDTEVVELLTDVIADTEANSMVINTGNMATTGTVGDGQFFTRLMQQKTNYLINVARGNYIPIGLNYELGFIDYDGFAQWVRWQKASGNNNRVAFETPVTTDGQGANLNITTDDVTTEVRFEGAVNIGILNATQAELLEDTAKRSDVYAANVAL